MLPEVCIRHAAHACWPMRPCSTSHGYSSVMGSIWPRDRLEGAIHLNFLEAAPIDLSANTVYNPPHAVGLVADSQPEGKVTEQTGNTSRGEDARAVSCGSAYADCGLDRRRNLKVPRARNCREDRPGNHQVRRVSRTGTLFSVGAWTGNRNEREYIGSQRPADECEFGGSCE